MGPGQEQSVSQILGLIVPRNKQNVSVNRWEESENQRAEQGEELRIKHIIRVSVKTSREVGRVALQGRLYTDRSAPLPCRPLDTFSLLTLRSPDPLAMFPVILNLLSTFLSNLICSSSPCNHCVQNYTSLFYAVCFIC